MVCVGELYLAAFLAVSTYIAVQGQDIYITSFPSPPNFREGSEVSIICEHDQRLTFDHMIHPTFGIISVSTQRFRIDLYRDRATLTIANAMESDEGRYKCVLRDGTAVVESTFLETYYRLPIVMTPPNQGGNITVAAGDSLNLTCSAENASRRQWLARPWGGSNRDVRVVSSTSDGKITVTSDKVVLFRGIELDDGALYSCLLGNDVEMAKIEYNVTVVVRPVATVTPAVQVVEEGAVASISCNVMGTALVVTWRSPDHMDITSSVAHGITIEETHGVNSLTSTLTVASLSGSLAGQYLCRAINSHGSDTSVGYIRLEGTPEPPTNVALTVVNRTSILVTWEAPNSEVTVYVVTWEPVSGSSAFEDPQSGTVNGSMYSQTRYLIMNLHRLTTYRVLVHGENSNGVGMDSGPATVTTTATVPTAPLSVVTLDRGPSSVRVEWSAATLPVDDGGSPLTTVRLTYRAMMNMEWPETWSSEAVIVDVAQGYALVSGLQDRTTYQVRMEVGNHIGYGPGAVSASFKTPQPGFPGSPSHVVARDITSDSAIICWRESAVGRPFSSYSVEVHESMASGGNSQLLRAPETESFPNCSTGVLVSDLQPGTCYTFVVYVTNSLGVGQPSPKSKEYCTATSCGEGVVCSQGAVVLSTPSIAGIAVGSVVVLAVLVALLACFALRQCKKSSLRRSIDVTKYYTDDSSSFDSKSPCSRESEQSIMSQSIRSGTGLLANGRNASFDSAVPPSSADSQSPDTATTIVSSLEQNPFDFSGNPSSHVMLHAGSQPVLHPHPESTNMEYRSANIEYPRPGGANVEYPQGVSSEYPMYPILEDPPPYPHQISRVFPALAQPTAPPCYPGGHGVTLMMDNPNYEEKQPHHVAHEHRYNGDRVSEGAGSEVPLQIPTPHFGESYSQSGYSPVLPRSQDRTEQDSRPNEGVRKEGTVSEDGQSQKMATQKSSTSDEGFDDDTEFIENDAYMTFPVRKFRIVSEERGSVFETVKVK